MIGSQPSLLRRTGWYRWLALGVLLAIVIGLQANGSHRASAVTHTYQVNSTADTNDGSCDAFSVSPPKDCTLREAINAANAAPNTGVLPDLDIITFLPSVFTVASPGTINLTASLPTIVDDLRINAAGSGVKIDGGGTYDGLNVVADNADFRFEILASTGHFILQGLAGDAVDLDGDGYSFGIVIIDGAQVGAPSHDVSGDGVDLYNTPDVNTVTITNNEITAGSVGVDVNVGLGSLSDNSVSINSNSITAYDNAVYVDFAGNLASTVTLNVNSNSNLVSTGYDALDLNFCDGSSCAIGTSTVSTLNFNVNENANIHGYYDGVDITINADDGSDNAHVNVNVNNLTQSGNITGDDGEAVDIYSNVCCEYSNSITNINVNGNSTGGIIRDLRGTDDGVNVWSRMCCGESNESHVGVNANRDVSGTNGNGVIVFSGAGDDGGNGTADNSKSTVNVDDNRDVSGAQDGVNIFAGAGGDGADDADGTRASASVSRNRDISGGGGSGNHGVQTDVGSGGNYNGGGSGSTNSSTTNVDGNRTITGKDAVHIGSYACCNDAGASETGNKNVVSVSDNTGLLKGSDDGIVIDGVGLYGAGFNDYVCCAAANTIAISDNNKIFGDKSTSDGENGIEISICGDARIGDSQQKCMDAANTALTISGNDISDSGQDGINVCCGSFSGSQISGNLIQRNADDGVHLTDTLGVKVGPSNTISGNGGSPDAGIVIDAYDFGLSPNPVAGANTITQNSISGNNGLGIDLGDDGVGCDISTFGNPNGCLKPPTLTIMTGAKLVGHAHAGSTVEIFKANESPPDNESGDDPQHGEGEVYQTSVAADSDGNFSVGLCGLTAGTRITATQTNGVGNTSEFSGNLILPATLGACVPTATPSFTPTKTATPTRTVTGTPPTATPTITETPTVTPTPPPATDTPVPPTATITPIPPTHTSTPIAKPCGDVNDDGVANSVDSALVLQLEAGLISSLANMPSADVNNDDHVNSVDAALILQYVAALISGLNC